MPSDRELNTWMSQIETRMLTQEAKPKEALRRPTAGGGGLDIPDVDELPALPTKGTKIVYHTVDENWYIAHADDTAERWFPFPKFSDSDGLEGS